MTVSPAEEGAVPGGSPWAPGTATGVGSLPGTDPLAAARTVFDGLPDLPHLPELPDRGPGSDLIGRGCGLLAELAVDLQPAGWRLVGRPGLDAARTRDLLLRDLDALQEAGEDYRGPLKLQAAGPWTLAASVELPRGDKVLSDPGACREVAQSLGEGLARQVADVRSRLPGVTSLLLQLDEPSLPAVLAGRLRTASGFGTLRTPEVSEAESILSVVVGALVGAGAVPAVHCCAPSPPLGLLRHAGVRVVGLDLGVLRPSDDDAVGEAVEAGVALVAGLVPATGPRQSAAATIAALERLWSRLGFDPGRLGSVAVSPSCGLAGTEPDQVVPVLRLARAAAEELASRG